MYPAVALEPAVWHTPSTLARSWKDPDLDISHEDVPLSGDAMPSRGWRGRATADPGEFVPLLGSSPVVVLVEEAAPPLSK